LPCFALFSLACFCRFGFPGNGPILYFAVVECVEYLITVGVRGGGGLALLLAVCLCRTPILFSIFSLKSTNFIFVFYLFIFSGGQNKTNVNCSKNQDDVKVCAPRIVTILLEYICNQSYWQLKEDFDAL